MSRVGSFVTHFLRGQYSNGQWSAQPCYHWGCGFGLVSDFVFRQRVQELAYDPLWENQTGMIYYPLDTYSIEQVRRYKSAAQLKADLPTTRRRRGVWTDQWGFDEFLGYESDHDGDALDLTVKKYIRLRYGKALQVAISTMYRDFTYSEISVPKHLLDDMADKGQFGTGFEIPPSTSISEKDYSQKRNHR